MFTALQRTARLHCGGGPLARVLHRSNHFQVLGVAETATVVEIKKAFYNRAKKLHPDANQHALNRQQLDANVAEFIKLRVAFETLIDERAKAEYLRNLNRSATGVGVSPGYGAGWGQNNTDPVDYSDYSTGIGGFGRRGRGPFRQKKPSDPDYHAFRDGYDPTRGQSIVVQKKYEWGSFQQELDEALEKAYMGPKFTARHIMDFPANIESEERNYDEFDIEPGVDIMNLVSGRHFMGKVRLSSLQLTGKGSEQLLLHADKFYESESDKQNEEHRRRYVAMRDDIISGKTEAPTHMRVAQYLKSKVEGVMESITKHGEDAHKSEYERFLEDRKKDKGPLYDDDSLEVVWFDHVVARATRRIKNDTGTMTIVFETLNSETMAYDVVAQMAVLADSLGREIYVLLDAQHQETHRVISCTQLGLVRNMIIYSKKCFVEFKCTRAPLPPPQFWVWEPRDENYSNGGWLIEQNVEQASYVRRFRQKHAMTEEIFKRAVGGGHYAYSDDVLGRRARRRDEESARRAYAADIAVTSQNNSVNAYKEPPDDSLHHTVPILLCAFDTLDSIRHKQTKASMKYNPFYEHMTR